MSDREAGPIFSHSFLFKRALLKETKIDSLLQIPRAALAVENHRKFTVAAISQSIISLEHGGKARERTAPGTLKERQDALNQR